MTGVDQNGNKVDTYVNAKLYYTTASVYGKNGCMTVLT